MRGRRRKECPVCVRLYTQLYMRVCGLLLGNPNLDPYLIAQVVKMIRRQLG